MRVSRQHTDAVARLYVPNANRGIPRGAGEETRPKRTDARHPFRVPRQHLHTFARVRVPETNVVVDGGTGEKASHTTDARDTPVLRQCSHALLGVLAPDVDLPLKSSRRQETIPQRATVPGIDNAALQCLETLAIFYTPDTNVRVMGSTRKPILAERPNTAYAAFVS